MSRRRPQAVRVTGRYAFDSAEHAQWLARADAALGGIAVFVGVIVIVVLLSLLGPQA